MTQGSQSLALGLILPLLRSWSGRVVTPESSETRRDCN